MMHGEREWKCGKNKLELKLLIGFKLAILNLDTNLQIVILSVLISSQYQCYTQRLTLLKCSQNSDR